MASSKSLKKHPEPIEVKGVLMQEILRKSVVPLYGVGVIWLLYALLLPLYRWFDFLIAAAVSAAVYFLLQRFFPGKKELVPMPEKPFVSTGNELADSIVKEGRDYLRQLKEINEAIPQPELSWKIDRMGEVAGKIFAFVEENPEKATSVRKFMNYYLPTTLELLRSYAKLDDQDVAGKNITAAMSDIEHIMDTVVPAFEKQLDALFQDEALDASVDIEVLRTMLAQEGLTDSDFDSKNT